MTNFDPLLDFEKNQKTKKTKIKISKNKLIFTTNRPNILQIFWRKISFFVYYILLSSSIFATMMFAVNFSAYFNRINHWINPNVYAKHQENIDNLINESSFSVISNNNIAENRKNRAIIEEKIAKDNPDLVYSRSYSPEVLLSNIPLGSAEGATFEVAPQENRIIVPKLGKNIPLIDVNHDEGVSYTEMHNIFMQELIKWVVRYPGTAEPGQKWNAFIFGHSSNYPWIKSDYNDVFALLDTLENGDEVIVYYNQKKFVYRITDRAIVKPGNVDVLNSRDPNKKEISLMTCWPIGTTLERIILFGELVE